LVTLEVYNVHFIFRWGLLPATPSNFKINLPLFCALVCAKNLRKFGEFLLSRCEDIVRLRYQNFVQPCGLPLSTHWQFKKNYFIKKIQIFWSFLKFTSSFYLSVGSPPGHPLKILKQFFLHFVWKCVRKFFGKFG